MGMIGSRTHYPILNWAGKKLQFSVLVTKHLMAITFVMPQVNYMIYSKQRVAKCLVYLPRTDMIIWNRKQNVTVNSVDFCVMKIINMILVKVVPRNGLDSSNRKDSCK